MDPLRVDYYKYLVTKDQAEKLTKEKDELKARLMEQAKKRGEQTPEGHHRLEFDESVTVAGRNYKVMKAEKRVQRFFSYEKAEELLTAKGLYDSGVVALIQQRILDFADDLLEEFGQPIDVEIDVGLSQDAVYALFQEGHLTEEEVLSLDDETITWAFQTRG